MAHSRLNRAVVCGSVGSVSFFMATCWLAAFFARYIVAVPPRSRMVVHWYPPIVVWFVPVIWLARFGVGDCDFGAFGYKRSSFLIHFLNTTSWFFAPLDGVGYGEGELWGE